MAIIVNGGGGGMDPMVGLPLQPLTAAADGGGEEVCRPLYRVAVDCPAANGHHHRLPA